MFIIRFLQPIEIHNLLQGGFDNQQATGTQGGKTAEVKTQKEEEKVNLDAPDLLQLEGEEEPKSDDDDTRRFTIKDFKEKAQRFVKDNFDKYASKKKPKNLKSEPIKNQ